MLKCDLLTQFKTFVQVLAPCFVGKCVFAPDVLALIAMLQFIDLLRRWEVFQSHCGPRLVLFILSIHRLCADIMFCFVA